MKESACSLMISRSLRKFTDETKNSYKMNETILPHTDLQNIDETMLSSLEAFSQYRNVSAEKKAEFLEAIAIEIESLGDEVINIASRETNLPEGRLTGERGRTCMQLRLFADMVKEGSWVEASVDTADAGRKPLPKADIRKMLIPLGPVVVFGSSNFPFAFSTAGGDTASALATGCSVVVKAHPGHSETSKLVAGAIRKAIEKCNMPTGVFQHIDASGFGAESFEIGKQLVQHPATAAVAFTGSLSGGKALYGYAHERQVPIPVFAEMGSINPVVFLPETLKKNPDSLAKMYAGSITLGMGQFCTNPGLMIAIESESLTAFQQKLVTEISAFQSAKMLHDGIQQNYTEKLRKALEQKGVDLITAAKEQSNGPDSDASIASVNADTFLKNPLLREEIFGPFSLIVKCQNEEELKQVWLSLPGQLTTCVMGTDEDFLQHKELINSAFQLAGRIIFNQAPTGVEVCASMIHGGPYPATTDSRFTSVGTTAAKRWVRPLCFQNCPEFLLPAELKNANPKKIWRIVNEKMYNGDVA